MSDDPAKNVQVVVAVVSLGPGSPEEKFAFDVNVDTTDLWEAVSLLGRHLQKLADRGYKMRLSIGYDPRLKAEAA